MRLVSAITLDVSRARFAESTTVGALRDRTTLLGNVLKLTFCKPVSIEYELWRRHATYLSDDSC